MIIWLTGPSESGKTTLGEILPIKALRLDGDELREAFDNWDFSLKARREHNLVIARLALVLSTQMNIIVSVIAPIQEVRDEITKICSPNWIYLKRDSLIPKSGHFYEIPQNYFTVDTDALDVKESIRRIMIHLKGLSQL